jgi:hypothetical protein
MGWPRHSVSEEPTQENPPSRSMGTSLVGPADESADAANEKIMCIKAIAESVGSKLQTLDLSDCHLPDKCIQELVQHVGDSLTSIDLSENPRIKFASVLSLCEKAQKLRKLKLNGCHGLKKHFDAFALCDNLPHVRCQSPLPTP